jgi:hypothetical protein
MYRFRAQIIALIGCLAIQGGSLYGLARLRANEELILTLEMIWLCAAVCITLWAGQRFQRK